MSSEEEKKTEEIKVVETVPNQWALMNRVLLIYKVLAAALASSVLALVILAYCLAMAAPVVIEREGTQKTYFKGRHESAAITDEDVSGFIEAWVLARYTWEDYNPEKIIRAIAPLTTEGLQEKIKAQLGKGASSSQKGQTVEQEVARIRVTLSEKEAVASFDRVIRINGIPIVAPLQVSLEVLKGSASPWNPKGLFVNGVVEHDEK